MVTITIIHQLVWVKYIVVIIAEVSGIFFFFLVKNPMNLLFDCLSRFDDMSVRLLYKCLESFFDYYSGFSVCALESMCQLKLDTLFD